MKKIIIEIIIIIAISGIVAIAYNATTERPLELIKKSLDERYIKEDLLFDESFEATPESLENTLSYRHMLKIVRHPDVLIIDARTPENFEKNKIGDAINIYPYMDESEYFEQIMMLPRDKIIILYCDGGTCDLSHNVASDMLNFGFKRVFLYYGGWEEWAKEKGIAGL